MLSVALRDLNVSVILTLGLEVLESIHDPVPENSKVLVSVWLQWILQDAVRKLGWQPGEIHRELLHILEEEDAVAIPFLYTKMGGQIMVMQLISTGVRSCRHLGIGLGLRSLSVLNISILALPW